MPSRDASNSRSTGRSTTPRAFLLYERYTDEDAFQAHRRTPHFGDIIERQVAPLLEERAWTRVEPPPA